MIEACILIHTQVSGSLGNRLLRLDRQFDCTLLKFGRLRSRRGLAHRTHLVCCESSVSPCVRKSIATSLQGFFLHTVLSVRWPDTSQDTSKRPPVEVMGLGDQHYYVRTPCRQP